MHAWGLMSNHYHLMVETPEGNLVAGMRWLQNTYTRRHNYRHRLWDRLFGDRYNAILNQILGASFTVVASGEDVAWGEAWESLWARE